jgi:hypothetical protein
MELGVVLSDLSSELYQSLDMAPWSNHFRLHETLDRGTGQVRGASEP